jgi:UDP-glucose 4-epimerase
VPDLVTGCAGFVGSTLVDRLLANGREVVGIDNFSTGHEHFLEGALASPRFRLVRGDLLDTATLQSAMRGVETVYHFAANADVRFGTDHPTKDFEQNAQATLNVLEAMRLAGATTIAFSSTGSIYGEALVIPTPEDAPIPIQTSLYGASKMAAEGFIEAYAEGFGMRAFIFRFVSLLGERYTHGHVIDFYRQLREHPERLRVLGDGKQRKSYLYVADCIDAVLHAMAVATDRVNVYNLGTDEYCQVVDSIGWITETLGVTPELEFSGGRQGWIGDNPFIFLDTQKIRGLGWKPTLTIREAVVRTVRHLLEVEPTREAAR